MPPVLELLVDVITEHPVSIIGALTGLIALLVPWSRTTRRPVASRDEFRRSSSFGRRQHDGAFLVGRNRVFGAIDKTLEQLRTETDSSYALLLFQVQRTEEYRQQSIKDALLEAVRSSCMLGVLDAGPGNASKPSTICYVVGIRSLKNGEAGRVLERAGAHLHTIVGAEDLFSGFCHVTGGSDGARDIYLAAKRGLALCPIPVDEGSWAEHLSTAGEVLSQVRKLLPGGSR
ncbi:MAG: hypothetical protein ACI8QZ_000116 [Chlamydiales bacterium]|jgi:hypothetical protein